jgi:hypothetical protein
MIGFWILASTPVGIALGFWLDKRRSRKSERVAMPGFRDKPKSSEEPLQPEPEDALSDDDSFLWRFETLAALTDRDNHRLNYDEVKRMASDRQVKLYLVVRAVKRGATVTELRRIFL